MNKYLLIGIVAILIIAGGWWYMNTSSAPASSETNQLPNLQEATNAQTATKPPVATTQTQSSNTQAISLPKTCVNGSVQTSDGLREGTPVITSVSPSSGPKGTKVTIQGCNLSGFEGDHNVDLERADGVQIRLRGAGTYQLGRGERGTFIEVTIKEPCQQGETVYGDYSGIPSECKYVELTPGIYKVSTTPWGEKSNVASFTVTQN